MRAKSLRKAVSRDQVARLFYKQFKAEHAAFAALIAGLSGAAEQAWVASLTLKYRMGGTGEAA
jgi:hypothetical protein